MKNKNITWLLILMLFSISFLTFINNVSSDPYDTYSTDFEDGTVLTQYNDGTFISSAMTFESGGTGHSYIHSDNPFSGVKDFEVYVSGMDAVDYGYTNITSHVCLRYRT